MYSRRAPEAHDPRNTLATPSTHQQPPSPKVKAHTKNKHHAWSRKTHPRRPRSSNHPSSHSDLTASLDVHTPPPEAHNPKHLHRAAPTLAHPPPQQIHLLPRFMRRRSRRTIGGLLRGWYLLVGRLWRRSWRIADSCGLRRRCRLRRCSRRGRSRWKRNRLQISAAPDGAPGVGKDVGAAQVAQVMFLGFLYGMGMLARLTKE